MQTNINIAKSFMETPDGVLSIHQISKKLELPYGTAYNRVHALHKLGVIQMLAQGKAKLCALNPDNAMTASLLALGSAQKLEEFIETREEVGALCNKLRKVIGEVAEGGLLSALILTPDILDFVVNPSLLLGSESADTTELQTIAKKGENVEVPQGDPNELLQGGLSLDLFYIQDGDTFNESQVESAVTSLLPPGFNLRVTSMTVDRKTMLGMFTESDNEVGLAAYSMLYTGMVLLGHENYYNLILEAFARRLTLL
jgi:hypothetical protein